MVFILGTRTGSRKAQSGGHNAPNAGGSSAVTWDPLHTSSSITLSNGNLTATSTDGNWHSTKATLARSSGKFYYELAVNSSNHNYVMFGGWISTDSNNLDVRFDNLTNWFGMGFESPSSAGDFTQDGGANSTISAVMQIAIDFGAGKIWSGNNNSWFNSGNPATGSNPNWTFTPTLSIVPALNMFNAGSDIQATLAVTSGQLTYSPPSGFSPWSS